MRLRAVIFILATMSITACEDDPIIGPTDNDTGGGSYGVIHFNTSPEEPARHATELDSLNNENPKRF